MEIYQVKSTLLRIFRPVCACTLAALLLAGCLSSEKETSGGTPQQPGGGPTNAAPTISGAPEPGVNVGNIWNFTPTASDPDRDSLTFSVQNPPPWTTFDSVTGTLSGEPGMADIGEYSNIVVSVSDGTLTASLAPFSVLVTQIALGSVTVAWSLPTQRTDGNSLSGLNAINLYYGVEQGSYPNKIQITNLGTTEYVIDNLIPDTYYIVSTVIDDVGVESNWSKAISVVVD